jgi:hypothetical protein
MGALMNVWEWLISPNHNEIVRDVADELIEWVTSPNHNEIVVADRA